MGYLRVKLREWAVKKGWFSAQAVQSQNISTSFFLPWSNILPRGTNLVGDPRPGDPQDPRGRVWKFPGVTNRCL